MICYGENMNLKTLLLLTVSALPVFAQTEVTIYANAGQRGASQVMRVGKNTVSGALAGKISSIAVPGEFTAQVCAAGTPDPHVLGRTSAEKCVTFPEGRFDLNSLNDRVTKVLVARPSPAVRDKVMIFTGRGQTGIGLSFYQTMLTSLQNRDITTGNLDGNAAPKWSQSISSIWIAEGYEAVVCSDNNRENFCIKTAGSTNLLLPAGRHDLPANFDGRTMRLRIAVAH